MEIVDRIRRLFLPDSGNRLGVVSRLEKVAPTVPATSRSSTADPADESQKVTDEMSIGGLRQRLENLEGVSAIHLELAETGLSGIKVSLNDGADEGAVLERIRSLLVTYGLRSPTAVSTEVEAGTTSRAGITTDISPEGEGMRVEVTSLGQSVVKLVEATPMAAAQAVAEGRARLSGHQVPKVLWIGLDSVGDWRILTVLLRVAEATPTVGASLVEGGWAEALDQAIATALLHQADSK